MVICSPAKTLLSAYLLTLVGPSISGSIIAFRAQRLPVLVLVCAHVAVHWHSALISRSGAGHTSIVTRSEICARSLDIAVRTPHAFVLALPEPFLLGEGKGCVGVRVTLLCLVMLAHGELDES